MELAPAQTTLITMAASSAGEDNISGVVIESRKNPDGQHTLLLEITGGKNTTVDEIRLKLPKKKRHSAFAGSLPAQWILNVDKDDILLSGSPVTLPLYLRIDLGKTPPPKKTNLEIIRKGARKYVRKGIIIKYCPPVQVSGDFSALIKFPPAVSPGEWVRFKPLDIKKTPLKGTWKIAGQPAEYTGKKEFYTVTLPGTLAEDSPLSLSYTDPYGVELYYTPELQDVKIILVRESDKTMHTITGVTPIAFVDEFICICGNFSGMDYTNPFRLDDGELQDPVSGSSHVMVYRLPQDLPPGLHRISGDPEAGFDVDSVFTFEAIRVGGSINRKTLNRGESTPLRLWVEGTEKVLTLNLTNNTPHIVSLEGGNRQAAQTSGGKNNKIERMVHSVTLGDFNINYTIRLDFCPCGGIYFQEKPEEPKEPPNLDEPYTSIPDTYVPTDEDSSDHFCVVAWIITGGTGGHKELSRGKSIKPGEAIGKPTQRAVERIAEGIKGANKILGQCGIQMHLCDVFVFDVSKVEDLHTDGKKLDKILFDGNGVTWSGQDANPPDPIETLYENILSHPQRELTKKYERCAQLFFVNDVQKVAKPDTDTSWTSGLGKPVGLRKKQPAGLLEETTPESIAHEIVHGLGYDGHTDEPVKGKDSPEEKKVKKDYKAATDRANDARDAANDAQKNAEAARDAADNAEENQNNAENAIKQAESELEQKKANLFKDKKYVKKKQKKVQEHKNDIDNINKKLPGANETEKSRLGRNLIKLTKLLNEAKRKRDRKIEELWNNYKRKYKNKKDAEEAEKKVKVAKMAAEEAKKAAEKAENAAKAAETKAASANEKAQKAEDLANNLMEAVQSGGTALMKSQCDILKQFMEKNELTCQCDD